MNRIVSVLIASCIGGASLQAQPPQQSSYSIEQIRLPAELDNQVCISGQIFYNGQLYMASERCPSIFILDPEKGTLTGTINFSLSAHFEMEGLTAYKDKLYLVTEDEVAVYEVTPSTGALRSVSTSIPLPGKLKSGDGMEGIAANEQQQKFYLLRERNEDLSRSQIYTFSVEGGGDTPLSLKYESMIELPLENPQWRYSDIFYDKASARLLCLKSYSKGKTRQQYLESLATDEAGNLLRESLQNIPVENFTETSAAFKTQKYSMNLEGITMDGSGNIFIVSDNTSGKAQCDRPALERTILLKLTRK